MQGTKLYNGFIIRGIAAGILPFFDNGRTILLGKEFRKNYNSYSWMEFGGKKDDDESLRRLPVESVLKKQLGL